MLQMSGQSIKACVSYSDFKRCCEKKKKIRRTLKAHISGTACLNLELEVPHPEGMHTENFVCLCPGSVELQMRENGVFITPVKYTLVCRVPWVSWAARHSTVCLDLNGFMLLNVKHSLP